MKFLALLLLAGCASPGLMCDMRTEYEHVQPIAQSGERVISWQFGVPPLGVNTPGVYGRTLCDGFVCRFEMRGNPPAFDDVCGLARLGHEVAHVMGATH